MKTFILASLGTVLASTAAFAGDIAPIPVSEPGALGLIAGGVIAAIAMVKLRGRK